MSVWATCPILRRIMRTGFFLCLFDSLSIPALAIFLHTHLSFSTVALRLLTEIWQSKKTMLLLHFLKFLIMRKALKLRYFVHQVLYQNV